jgi:hypothetical protein
MDPETVGGEEDFLLSLVEDDERPIASKLAQEGRTLLAESMGDRVAVESAGPGNEESVVFVRSRSADGGEGAAFGEEASRACHAAGAQPLRHPVEPLAADGRLAVPEPTAKAGHSKPPPRKVAQRSSSRIV